MRQTRAGKRSMVKKADFITKTGERGAEEKRLGTKLEYQRSHGAQILARRVWEAPEKNLEGSTSRWQKPQKSGPYLKGKWESVLRISSRKRKKTREDRGHEP